MSELVFDPFHSEPQHFVENGPGHCPEAVGRHLFVGVAHCPEGGSNPVFTKGAACTSGAGEHIAAVPVQAVSVLKDRQGLLAQWHDVGLLHLHL